MVANVPVTPIPKVTPRGQSPAKAKRAPLLPSEADNNNGPSLPRRPKSRDVSSRYVSSTLSSASITTAMTSTSSSSSFSSTTTTSSSNSMCTPRRRFPSPIVYSSNLMTPPSTVNNKRAQSTERRRPGTGRTGETEMSATAKMLTSKPAMSLSASFQGGSFSLPVSKTSKPAPTASNDGSRQSTPQRRAATPTRKSVNSKTTDQQRWPARSRQGSFMTKSVDFTNENMKLNGSGTASAVNDLRKSMIRAMKLKPTKPEIPEPYRNVDKLADDCDKSVPSVSDAESVSSGSSPGTIRGRGVMVPARFRQETVNRSKKVQPEPVSPPLSRNNKLLSGNRYQKDGPTLSPRGRSPSPVRGVVRPSSPSKSVLSLSSRGIPGPVRERSGIGSNSNLGSTPSILNFAAEARRRKGGEDAIVDAHALRLLHNKYLQWRFVNARADATMLVQSATAQKSLYNAYITTSKMRQSVLSKQVEIQQLRQNLKLHSLLKNQIPCLKVWDQSERDHSVSLSGAIVSLKSTTLRLPLVDGAKAADVQNLEDAICSAVDVMQAMASSICSLVTKVEQVNALAFELANTSTNERSLLDRCKDLLSMVTQMEIQKCSLRTHMIQLQGFLPQNTMTEM